MLAFFDRLMGMRAHFFISNERYLLVFCVQAYTVIGGENMKNDQSDSTAVSFVDEVIAIAIRERASDIHFEPRENEMIVRIRVDGVLRRIGTVTAELRERVISRLKVISGINLTERKKAQDGRASINENVDIRISTLPVLYGEKVVIRILNKLSRPSGAKSLGIEDENLIRYKRLLHSDSGLILIAGPTGSGKTSTMYQMLTELAHDEVNIVTLEDPIEYNIAGTNQIAINERVGMTFPAAMKSVLRQDPDIIAIGEIRDAQTAEIAYRSAITGHLTLTTVHTKNASTLLNRMDSIGINTAMMEGTLRGVIIQQLVKRVCKKCRGSGCEACGGTGYYGRVGVFGVSTFTDKVTPDRLRDADIALSDNCRNLVERGITTKLEAEHVLDFL